MWKTLSGSMILVEISGKTMLLFFMIDNEPILSYLDT